MLFAIQGSLGRYCMWMKNNGSSELSSQDHSATSTFFPSRRLFQGPGLPPSNAVFAHITPGDPPLLRHYYQARRGKSTFYSVYLSQLHLLPPSPLHRFGKSQVWTSSECRCLLEEWTKLVVDNRTVDIVQAYPYEDYLRGPPSDCGGRQWQTIDAGKDDWRTGSGWWKRMFGTSSHPELRHT